MSYFNYNGKHIFYSEVGKGEPCIFLHGNTASSRWYLHELCQNVQPNDNASDLNSSDKGIKCFCIACGYATPLF